MWKKGHRKKEKGTTRKKRHRKKERNVERKRVVTSQACLYDPGTLGLIPISGAKQTSKISRELGLLSETTSIPKIEFWDITALLDFWRDRQTPNSHTALAEVFFRDWTNIKIRWDCKAPFRMLWPGIAHGRSVNYRGWRELEHLEGLSGATPSLPLKQSPDLEKHRSELIYSLLIKVQMATG